ncbi:MAG: PilZ domain-containing protein [Acidobacteria bacterium]|nr:PilZ domain-containing protein [Acidobacteriota bacterium]
MENPEDRRSHARLSLDDRFTLRFQVEGQVYRGVPMTNLSIGGLGLKMEHRTAIRMHNGVILKGMVLEHPALPQTKVDGEVRHVMGRHMGNMEGPVLVGVQFLNPPENFTKLLEAFIDRRARS